MRPTETFANAVSVLFAGFGKVADEASFMAYWFGLGDIDESAVERAVRRAVRECKFLPKPAELRELAGIMSPSERALLAWQDVETAISRVGFYGSPDFEDKYVNATIRSLGGWLHVCELESDEYQKWFRRDFLKTYETLARRATLSEEHAARLGGEHERMNRINGYEVVPATVVASNVLQHDKSAVPRLTSKPTIAALTAEIANQKRIG